VAARLSEEVASSCRYPRARTKPALWTKTKVGFRAVAGAGSELVALEEDARQLYSPKLVAFARPSLGPNRSIGHFKRSLKLKEMVIGHANRRL
jgi:hypothetical protein